MHVNYTTYDVRRDYDIIHPRRSNIMMFDPGRTATSTEAPAFCYAKVLSIFHANVFYMGQDNRDLHPRRIEFLWVQWYELKKVGSWVPQRLDELYFPSASNNDSFGFLDPAYVLRACHIILSFRNDRVFFEGQAGFSRSADDKNDWKVYFVNR